MSLSEIDAAGFRLINQNCCHPALDYVMPLFSSNPVFWPALLLLATGLIWKGGVRGRLFVAVLALSIALGDGLVINTIKHAFARARPHTIIEGANLLVGKGSSASMPSSHTATWFAATLLSYVYYRRTIFFMLPLAVLMAFSRVYVGSHYPSDVVVGAILGGGYAAAVLWGLCFLWGRFGRTWFPEAWKRMPNLAAPPSRGTIAGDQQGVRVPEQTWFRLGYLLIAVVVVARLLYIASGKIELSEDEAYQWLWSKHLALSYYSKPPMIAWLQFLGTSLWGDTHLGVRFFSPVIAGVLGVVLLRFFARVVNPRAAFWLAAILLAVPLLGVGSTLLTVDPPLVLFWTLAMITGWKALQPQGSTADWLWTGLWLGLGFLSKYTALFEILCFALFVLLWKPARAQLGRPGPWLALGVVALATLPVIIWNAQHDWITVSHVGDNALRSKSWSFTIQPFLDFFFGEAALLNPIFFFGILWAMVALWREPQRRPLLLYFFCLGAPVFLGYAAFTFYKRAFHNWIAPAIVPLFAMLVVYWEARWNKDAARLRPWLTTGMILGIAAVLLLHDTNLVGKIVGRTLPAKMDPLRRVRGWSQVAAVAGEARNDFLQAGKPVFIIADHYGLVGGISFYLPEARASVSSRPLVYYKSTEKPENQFFFWPGYHEQRKGENAIYVHEVNIPSPPEGWFWPWLTGSYSSYVPLPKEPPPPPELLGQFNSVKSLGLREIKYRGRTFRIIQLFACENLL